MVPKWGEDANPIPIIAVTCIISWGSATVLYSLTVTLYFCCVKRHSYKKRKMQELYDQERYDQEYQ